MLDRLLNLVRKLGPLGSVCAVLLVITDAPGVAHAQRILVVISAESTPYIDAAKRCESSLIGHGRDVELVTLEEIDHEQLKRRGEPVIAIGGPAAVKLSELLPASTPLYYCMTPNPDRYGLTQRQNTSGVSTEPDVWAQIALIKESGIRVGRVGFLYRSGIASSLRQRDRLAEALPESWSLEAIDLDAAGSVSKSIELLFQRDIDLVWTTADAAVFNSSLVKALLLHALRNRVPVFGFSHALVRAGAPIGVGLDPETQGERVARLAVENRLGAHEPAHLDLAINRTVLSRIDLVLDNDFERGAAVTYGSD